MTLSRTDMARQYPLPSYNYKVEVMAITAGSGGRASAGSASHSAMSFSEVSGLEVGYEHSTYSDGMSYAEGPQVVRGKIQSPSITLKRGMIAGQSGITDWIQTAGTSTSSAARKRDLLISLCDAKGGPLITWKVRNAVPVKLSAPSLTAESNAVAIESLQLVASRVDITFQKA